MKSLEVPVVQTDLLDKHPLPAYAREGDAGADLVAAESATLKAGGGRKTIPLAMKAAIPAGYAGLVMSRSGLAAKHGVICLNAPGVIDSGYRDEWKVVLCNTDTTDDFYVSMGDRIAQLVVVKVEKVGWLPVTELNGSERGTGGFGHTGLGTAQTGLDTAIANGADISGAHPMEADDNADSKTSFDSSSAVFGVDTHHTPMPILRSKAMRGQSSTMAAVEAVCRAEQTNRIDDFKAADEAIDKAVEDVDEWFANRSRAGSRAMSDGRMRSVGFFHSMLTGEKAAYTSSFKGLRERLRKEAGGAPELVATLADGEDE